MTMNPQTPPTSGEPRLTPQNPWPGLAAFTVENHEFFYGREAEIAEIFRRVRRQMLTVLFGVSGLGKTSLLQAGLLPRLDGTPFHPILIRLDHRPEAEDLIEQLRAMINREVPLAAQSGVKIPRGPGPGEDLWAYFHDKTTGWRNAEGKAVFPVLVFDQFEEIFTHESHTRVMEERRERFKELLACLVENRAPDALERAMKTDADLSLRYDFRQDDYRVVISLREDFLAHLESFKQRMPSVMENRMRLERMSEEQALQAVLGPGREIVEESVAREIVAFVAGNIREGHGALDAGDTAVPAGADPVLLSLLCEQLNRLRLERKQERITADLLTQEREGIIQGFYEQSFKDVDPRVREWVEDKLLTGSGHRIPAALEDALQQGLPATDLEELEKRRILHREKRGDVVLVELTHDLLCDPASRSRASRAQRRQAEEIAARAAAAAKRERELRRQKSRWKLAFAALLFVSLAAMGGILRHMYDHDWTYVRYYANYTKHFGIPHGVGLLDEDQVKHRSWSLKFIYRGEKGPLISMQAVDHSDRLTPYNDVSTYFDFDATSQSRNPKHACQWEYVLDTKGRIAYEMAYDKATNLVLGLDYSPTTSDKPAVRQAHFVGSNGLPKSQSNSKMGDTTTHSSANYIQIEYNADGLETNVSYLDWFGNPQSGPNGQFADEKDYANGMPKQIESLGMQGRPMRDNTKTTTRAFVRDQQGNVIEELWFDAEGRKTFTTNGYAEVKMSYDDYGNEVEWSCFDTSNNPVIDCSGGIHMAKMKYDDQGNWIEWECFGTNGQPVDCNSGYAKKMMSYDDRGDLVEWSCFDTNNNPTIDSDGKHMAKMEYDDQGNETEWECFGVNGQPVDGINGYARETIRYDSRGNLIEWSCFDTNGAPAIDLSDGTHMTKMEYDDQDNRVKWACFGISNQPVNCNGGYAIETTHYDNCGNLVEWSCFDTNGAPTVDLTDGKFMAKMKYDNQGNRIEWACFGTNGQPVDCNGGYAEETMSYDNRGDLVEWSCFDTNGAPTVDSADGKHTAKMKYDDQGNEIEWACFGTSGQPLNCNSGYARETMSYDARGDMTEESYFDAAGNPVDMDGYARETMGYDERGNVTEESYFDTSGNPVNNDDGYAKVTVGYDERKFVIEKSYFDTLGNPVNTKDGYAMVKMNYDEFGNVILESYFDASGQPVNGSDGYAGITKRFNGQNHIVEESFFYNPGTNGYARETMSYDNQGNLVEWSCFDASGQPTVDFSDGKHMVKIKYDDHGNRIEWACFGTNNQPSNSTGGYARETMGYDGRENLTNDSYFDISGQPINGKDGYAEMTRYYDGQNHLVEESDFYEPVTNGYARETARYDESGNVTNEAFYDASGNLADNLNGFAKVTMSYDDQGHLIEWSCFDAHGEPAVDRSDGTHTTKMKYDDQGNRIEWTCFDTNGQPVNSKDGFARETTSYDANGNLTEEAYFDALGNPVNNKDGYARETRHYDDQGNLTEDLYFDASGKSVKLDK